MTTQRQTATQISNAIVASLNSSLNTVFSLFSKSFVRVLAKTLGGIWVLLYQFAGFAILQTFVRTASNKPITINGTTITPLKEHAAEIGMEQGTGQAAEHTIDITVLSQVGNLISGTKIANAATEVVYQIIGDVALDAATVSATIRALEIGTSANVDNGQILSFVSAPASVAKDAVVTARTTEGVDAETEEVFRQRVIDAKAARPQGGAGADYRQWGQDVVGVKRVYPYSGITTMGYVDVYVESTTDTDGIPSQALLDDVYDAIQLDDNGIAYRRQINAYVTVHAITRQTYDVIVSGLNAPDVPAAQSAIESAIESYFLQREPWITGLAVLPRYDVIASSELAGVVGRVASSVGGYITGVAMLQGAVPVDLYSLQEGEKAKVGTVSWT